MVDVEQPGERSVDAVAGTKLVKIIIEVNNPKRITTIREPDLCPNYHHHQNSDVSKTTVYAQVTAMGKFWMQPTDGLREHKQ